MNPRKKARKAFLGHPGNINQIDTLQPAAVLSGRFYSFCQSASLNVQPER
jgi:hypothetical protein